MPGTFVAVANCIGARINAHFDAYPAVMNNVMHFYTASAVPSTADCLAVATLVATWVTSKYVGILANNWTIDSVEAWGDDSPTGAYALVAVGSIGLMGPTSQPDAAPLALLKTSTRGRSTSGRFYCLAPQDAEILKTQYAAAHQLDVIAALESLKGDSTIAGFPLAVKSETLMQTKDVQSVRHSARLTKQERRRLGFGG